MDDEQAIINIGGVMKIILILALALMAVGCASLKYSTDCQEVGQIKNKAVFAGCKAL